MTTRYKTRAFVFKKNDVNEADRNFSVFTDDFGRLDIFAKAIRKSVSKLRSGIDIFFISEIEFVQGKNKKTLTDAIVIEKFGHILDDLKKYKIASRIGEIINSFIKGEEKDEEIFILVSRAMKRLNSHKLSSKTQQFIFYYFLWNFFSIQGYHLEVKNCASCHNGLDPQDVYFSSKEGGIICKKCLSKDNFAQKINSDVVKILRIILQKDWTTLSKLKIELSSQNLLAEVSGNAIKSFCS